MELLILKTGALGDVLRTTSILPDWRRRHPGTRVTWLTAPAARDLLIHNPDVERVELWDARRGASTALLETPWTRILSLDDEPELCALASELRARHPQAILSGAHLGADGERVYSDDVAPWFDMGLISRHGRAAADQLKIENRRSHPDIFAHMFGVEATRPALHLPREVLDEVAPLFEGQGRPWIGLNTGAGGRWPSKRLDVPRTLQLMQELDRRLGVTGGRPTFVLLGGADEAERNAEIARGAAHLSVVDSGTDNPLLRFAALVSRLDLLVTSDSLALHVAVACGIRLVAFFAPTSAAEIELFGLGEKVVSTAPDACSYRADADTSSLTTERLADAVERVLAHPTASA